MLEQLILNNKLEAAIQFQSPSQRSLRMELMDNYKKGKRLQFLKYFKLLRRQFKLEFYLRVYFLIYVIHPSFGAKSKFSQQQITAFRNYIDAQGKQITKNDEFLSFCALPYVQKPLQHSVFRILFSKQWVSNLTEKLQKFISQQQKRMKQVSVPTLQTQKMQSQIQHYKDKYAQLQQNQKQLTSQFHKCAAQSQGKWLQVTRQLTQQSLKLIQMISQSQTKLMHQGKFLRVKKKIHQYERMLQKELQELMSQSQDISLFDRPSIDVSYSVSYVPAMDNNITGLSIEEYTPINYTLLKKDLKLMQIPRRILIVQGFVWRILRSKDLHLRRMHIVSLFLTDVFQFRSGKIDLFENQLLCHSLLRLFQAIAQDLYGQKVLYKNAGYYREVQRALPILFKQQCYPSLKIALRIIQILSPQSQMTKQLVGINTVSVFVTLLRGIHTVPKQYYQPILEPILSVLLNMSTTTESFGYFQKERDIFTLLIKVFHPENQDIRTFIMAIIYSLICSRPLLVLAQSAGVPSFITRLLENPNPSAQNRQQAATIMQKMNSNVESELALNENEEESLDSQGYAEAFQNRDEELDQLQEYIKGHELLSEKYTLYGQPAAEQMREINQSIREFKTRRKSKGKEESKENKGKEEESRRIQYRREEENKSDVGKMSEIKKAEVIETKYQHRKLRVVEEDNHMFKSPSFKNMGDGELQNYALEKGRVQSSKQKNSRQEEKQSNIQNNKGEKQNQYRIKKSASMEKKLQNRGGNTVNLSLRDERNKPRENEKQKQIQNKYKMREENRSKDKIEFSQRQKQKLLELKEDSINKRPKQKNKQSFKNNERKQNTSQSEENIKKDILNALKSPPRKKSRQQILRSINEQLKAQILPRAPMKQQRREQWREQRREQKNENRPRRMNNFIEGDEAAFVAKPKLRRTPPKDD